MMVSDNVLDISIVIPAYNEGESLSELVEWIERVMNDHDFSHEIIIVDDGSTDGSWKIIRELSEKYRNIIRGISFRSNYGKSAALYCGFMKAQGKVVFTMDADMQDSPEEIPEMYRMLIEGGFDLVSGYKQDRQDNTFTKVLPSKIYNAVARCVTGVKLHDMNCGLKAYRKDVIKNIEVYGEMHRYIPYLSKNAGFGKISEKPVKHDKRKYGKSKFGMERFVNGFLDLLTLWFLTRFGKRPMHFFGYSGLLMFLLGFILVIYIILDKLIKQSQDMSFRAITDQPLFYLSLVAVILGTMLFLSGFIAEIICRNSSDRNKYNIKDEF